MSQVASIARIVLILPALLLTVSLSVRGQTEMVTIEDGKSRLLESMLYYTTWPDEDRLDRFVLGLYGRGQAAAAHPAA